MNTPFNQYNEVFDYFVIEGYQGGCISITNDQPTDADLNLPGFVFTGAPMDLLYPVDSVRDRRKSGLQKNADLRRWDHT
jgi:hypothetical protein